MKRRYLLAPQAARDLAQIWRYLKKENAAKPPTALSPSFATNSDISPISPARVTGAAI